MNNLPNREVIESDYLVCAVKDQAVLPADDGPGDGAVGEGKVCFEPDLAELAFRITTQRLKPEVNSKRVFLTSIYNNYECFFSLLIFHLVSGARN